MADMPTDREDRDKSREERLRELADALQETVLARGAHDEEFERWLPLLAAHEDAVRAARDMDWWEAIAAVDAVAPTPEAVRAFMLAQAGDAERSRIETEGRAMAAEAGKREAEDRARKTEDEAQRYFERLSEISKWVYGQKGYDGGHTALTAVQGLVARLEAEVAQLKAALQEIAAADPDAPEVESWKWLARRLMEIAREALKNKET
jgi:hypothetical protein